MTMKLKAGCEHGLRRERPHGPSYNYAHAYAYLHIYAHAHTQPFLP